MRFTRLVLILGLGLGRLEGAGAQTALAITHVTVIDVTGGPSKPDQTVVIQGNRIASIGRSGPPRGATVVDGRGKFLIPGLWDMHVHTTVPGAETLLSMFIANGVTGVRDMNDSFAVVTGWRRRIADGSLVGPRIVAAGPYIEGGWVPIPHLVAKTPEAGRAAVDSLRTLGVDFVKIHNRLSRETYFAIAEEVKKLNWSFAGHVPDSVTIAEASDAGQRSLEHLFGFSSVCTAEEREALKPLHPIQKFMGTCAEADPTPSFARVAANGTWVTPTLVVMSIVSQLPDSIQPDSTDRYRSPGLKKLEKMMFSLPSNLTPEQGRLSRKIYAKRIELVGLLHRAGVRLLIGSDAPSAQVFPGFGVHDELGLFVRGGVPPLAALRAATYEPARYFNALDSLGTIEPGKVADLVVLDADPLADIRNTRRIHAVIWNGRLIDQARRQELLRAAEAAAR